MRITVEIPDDADLTQDISFTMPRNFWSKLYQDFDNAIEAIKAKAEEQADACLKRDKVKPKSVSSQNFEEVYYNHLRQINIARQAELYRSLNVGLASQQAAGLRGNNTFMLLGGTMI